MGSSAAHWAAHVGLVYVSQEAGSKADTLAQLLLVPGVIWSMPSKDWPSGRGGPKPAEIVLSTGTTPLTFQGVLAPPVSWWTGTPVGR